MSKIRGGENPSPIFNFLIVRKMRNYGKMPLISPKDTLTYEDLMHVRTVDISDYTKENPFYYTDKTFSKWFDPKNAKVGSRFVDANNGDNWRVISVNNGMCRMVVQNMSQQFIDIMHW